MEIQATSANFFDKVVTLLNEARKAVVRNVNQTMVYTYFEIGRMIVEHEQEGKTRAEYGKKVLLQLSERLTKEFGRGFSLTNLEQMRFFYKAYSSIPQTMSEELQVTKNENIEISEALYWKSQNNDFQLSWSHYLKLMRIDDIAERRFYEIESISNNWSLRELQRQCDSALYQRLVLSRDKKAIRALSEKGHIIEKPEDVLKDPYILEFTGLPESAAYSENDLEQKLIDKLEHFLLELGKGFTFAGRQVSFTFDEEHFRVDLVFYNRILQCFVLIDLKLGKLKHQDLGQIQMYVNYYDRYVKLEHENKTIGIVLCQDKNETLVKITLPEDNKQIFASKYQTILPSKDEFKRVININ